MKSNYFIIILLGIASLYTLLCSILLASSNLLTLTIDLEVIFRANFLILFCFLLINFNLAGKFRHKLRSAKILSGLNILIVFSLVFDILHSISLHNNNIFISQVYFNISLILNSLIPFILVYFVSSYTNDGVSIRKSIPAFFIFVYHVSLIFLSLLDGEYISKEYSILFANYPISFSTALLILAYALSGIQILTPVINDLKNFKQNTKRLRRFRVLFISAIIGLLFIIPSIELSILSSINTVQSLISYIQISKILKIFILSVVLFIFQIQPSLVSSFITQPVEKIVIMNNGGLPLLSVDFINNQFSLDEHLIFSASLRAITGYLGSYSKKSYVKSINMKERQFRLLFSENAIFLMVTKSNTELLQSAFYNFRDFFLNQYPKINEISNVVDMNYINFRFVRNLLTELFGIEFPDEFKTKETIGQNKSNYIYSQLINIIFPTFIVISSLRFAMFSFSNTILNNLYLSNLTIISLIPMSLLLIMITIINYYFLKRVESDQNVRLALIALLFYIFAPFFRGTSQFLFSFYFLFISIYLFTDLIKHRFSAMPLSIKINGLIYAFMLDIIIRLGFLGTDPIVIFSNSGLYMRIIISGLFITCFQILKQYEISEKMNFPTNKYKYNGTFSIIIILLLIKYGLNSNIINTTSLVNGILIQYISTLTFLLLIQIFLIFQIQATIVLKNSLILVTLALVILIINYSLYFSLFNIANPIISAIFAIFLVLPSREKVFEWFKRRPRIEIFTFVLFFIFSMSLLFATYYFLNNLYLIIPLFIFLISKKIQNYKISKNIRPQTLNLLSLIISLLIVSSIFLTPIYLVSNFQTSNSNNMREIGVMTYNIQYGVSPDGTYNAYDIAEYIALSGVSIVALQEVTRSSFLNGNGDLYLQISKYLSNYGFDYSLIFEIYPDIITNVIVSKFPIISHSQYIFSENEIYQKGFISAIIHIKNKNFEVINTHLTHILTQQGNVTRNTQTDEILKYIAHRENIILTGDFNVQPSSPEIIKIGSRLNDSWSSEENGYTWPSLNPNQRIDYIFSAGIEINTIYTGDVTYSDHFPVIAWFALNSII